LSKNPRFSGIIGQQDGTQFARSLQQAGYATDPMYADKLARIINGKALAAGSGGLGGWRS
jgi:flagellar protein FlgJ